ncbi:MAG: hypothetical protein U1E74_01205 [Paenacidovorax caeni]
MALIPVDRDALANAMLDVLQQPRSIQRPPDAWFEKFTATEAARQHVALIESVEMPESSLCQLIQTKSLETARNGTCDRYRHDRRHARASRDGIRNTRINVAEKARDASFPGQQPVGLHQILLISSTGMAAAAQSVMLQITVTASTNCPPWRRMRQDSSTSSPYMKKVSASEQRLGVGLLHQQATATQVRKTAPNGALGDQCRYGW